MSRVESPSHPRCPPGFRRLQVVEDDGEDSGDSKAEFKRFSDGVLKAEGIALSDGSESKTGQAFPGRCRKFKASSVNLVARLVGTTMAMVKGMLPCRDAMAFLDLSPRSGHSMSTSIKISIVKQQTLSCDMTGNSNKNNT